MIALWLMIHITASEPTGYLIQPIPRKVDGMTRMSEPPCGGLAKGKSHLLAQSGSRNEMTWLVTEASPQGNCSVSLSIGTDYSHNYTHLFPMDGSASNDGWFPCGRIENFVESKVFKFPGHISCDQCTLQWVWQTETGHFYECVDVEIDGDKPSSCTGKCLNGGVCVEQECMCTVDYSGQFCDKEVNPEASHSGGFWLVFIVVVLLIIVAVLAYSIWYIRNHKIPQAAEKMLQDHAPFVLKNRNPDLSNLPDNS